MQYEKFGTTELWFFYDPDGTPSGVRYKNGSTTADYYFVCNWRGDVFRIYDSTGALVANYTYDAWGKVTSVTDANGAEITSPTHIANVNPIRYRGYYYDSETGYYYINARYYAPEVGRWFSPEPNVDYGEFDEGAGLISYNVYAYCANNPINMIDCDGQATVRLKRIGSVVVFGTACLMLTKVCFAAGLALLCVAVGGALISKGINIYKKQYSAAISSASSLMDYASTAATPPPPNKKGGKGTRVTSKTLYTKRGKNGFHIDVENPGNRIGQIHLQKNGVKYYYNVSTKTFRIGSSNGKMAPKAIQQLLKNENVIKAIGKGLKILGY